MNLNTILLCCILTLFSSCKGQIKTTETNFTTIVPVGEVFSGMDKSIWVIFQDSKNNYWFGSDGNGVYRYDGKDVKDVKQFTEKDGLKSNQIRGIQEDKLGNIYVETPLGINKFDGQKFVSVMTMKTNQWKLQPDDLWFKKNGEGIGAYRFDGNILHDLDFSTISDKKMTSAHSIYSIYKDKKGNIWFGTESGGVCRFDGANLEWIYENELGPLPDGRVPAIRSILEDENGYFWFSNLLYQYKIKTKDSKSIEYERVNRIDLSQQKAKMGLPYYTSALFDNDTLWMTAYKEGIWKYDGKNLFNYRIKDEKTDVRAMSIYKDNAGTLWICTENAGVYKFNGKSFENFKL